MQIDIGSIHEGVVTGLTKFGAFVKLENGTSGMVHISEVASEYVSDISQHLAEGDKVKVKVLESYIITNICNQCSIVTTNS